MHLPTINSRRVLYTTLSHSASSNFNPALAQKFVENRLRAAESAGIPRAAALQKESPLGGCAAGVANLGGGSHPVAQASLHAPSPTPFRQENIGHAHLQAYLLETSLHSRAGGGDRCCPNLAVRQKEGQPCYSGTGGDRKSTR